MDQGYRFESSKVKCNPSTAEACNYSSESLLHDWNLILEIYSSHWHLLSFNCRNNNFTNTGTKSLLPNYLNFRDGENKSRQLCEIKQLFGVGKERGLSDLHCQNCVQLSPYLHLAAVWSHQVFFLNFQNKRPIMLLH